MPKSWKENIQLANWISDQRQSAKRGKLSRERIKKLDDIVFNWGASIFILWPLMYYKLMDYKEAYGNCNVPNEWMTDKKLGRWVASQRELRKKGRLQQERVDKLDSIDFEWGAARSETWAEMFFALMDYKTAHGDCNVPSDWPADQKLANWVMRQRQLKKQGVLSEEQVGLLEKNGFCCATNDEESSWKNNYDELVRYRNANGHCYVPTICAQNQKLANWVAHQRRIRKKEQLSEEKLKLLNDIEFCWKRPVSIHHTKAGESSWKDMYDELVRYKKDHGHLHITAVWKENRKLVKWVALQRYFRKKGKLGEEKLKLLNDIDFCWELKAEQ